MGSEPTVPDWDWGHVVDRDGDPLPPGACDGYHNKHRHRDVLHD